MNYKFNLLANISAKEFERYHKKVSFWPTDCLRPSIEIYWRFVDEQETNPIEPCKFIMFKAAKLFELALVDELISAGIAADIENDDVIKALDLKLLDEKDEFWKQQIRVEMEREFIPITGYIDAITTEGFPIEIKSYYNTAVSSNLENGFAPNDNYMYQLACYMDYLGKDTGYLCMVSRATGDIHFCELKHEGNLVYTFISNKDYKQNVTFDLKSEYKRFRKLMEDNIHSKIEPPLDYEYRPKITKELLNNYPEDKIKKAIKGERVLSDHRWRPQYCNWKDLWIKKECEAKGFNNPEDLCRYTSDEIELMMDYLNVEWKKTKRGMQLCKKKEKRK